MTNKQDQAASGGSNAIQIAGNAVINQGLSTLQIGEIIGAISTQISSFRAEAEGVVQERLEVFKNKLLLEFAKPGKANPEAFRDPDFQYTVMKAQTASARRGSEEVDVMLTTLIGERSLLEVNTRVALTWNHAVDVAALLTRQEYAALSLVLFLRSDLIKAGNAKTITFQNVLKYFEHIAHEVSRESPSYFYLMSYGCAQLSTKETDIFDRFIQTEIPGIYQSGFNLRLQDNWKVIDHEIIFSRRTPAGYIEYKLKENERAFLEGFLLPCTHDAERECFTVLRDYEIEAIFKACFETNTDGSLVDPNQWAMMEDLIMIYRKTIRFSFYERDGEEDLVFYDYFRKIEEAVESFSADFVELLSYTQEISRLWKKTALSELALSPVGSAVGYAYLRRFFPEVFPHPPRGLR